MAQAKNLKLFFIINPGSGNNSTDWNQIISDYFAETGHQIELYNLPKNCDIQTIKDKISAFAPDQVVAVGGDGTVKLAADCLLGQNIALGILPAGSANGLAKELGISNDSRLALDTLLDNNPAKIHAIQLNGHLCIHLSDIGLNAYAMKIFETQRVRGMWGYLIAAIKVLWRKPVMEIDIKIDQKTVKVNAEMVVIANATQYGSGAVINPVGRLDDSLFEVIAFKTISVREMLKVIFLRTTYNSDHTEIFQTDSLSMRSAKKVHFQVDGEYLGKIKEVKALLLPAALTVMMPCAQENMPVG